MAEGGVQPCCQVSTATRGKDTSHANRVGGVEETGDQHQQVTAVHRQRREFTRVAARGHDDDAEQRDDYPDALDYADRMTQYQQAAQQHENRDRALQDTDIDGTGIMARDVKQRVEGGKPAATHQKQERQVPAQHRPVDDDLPACEYQ
jgi:hypothetical protein